MPGLIDSAIVGDSVKVTVAHSGDAVSLEGATAERHARSSSGSRAASVTCLTPTGLKFLAFC